MKEIVIERIEAINPKQDAPAWHVVFTEKPGEAYLIKTYAGTYNDKYAQCNGVHVRHQSVPRWCFSEDALASQILGNQQWWNGGKNTRLTIADIPVILEKAHILAVTDVAGSKTPAQIRVGSAACFFGFDVHYLKSHYFPMPQVTAIYRRIL